MIFLPGPTPVTVFTNGIPSDSKYIVVATVMPEATPPPRSTPTPSRARHQGLDSRGHVYTDAYGDSYTYSDGNSDGYCNSDDANSASSIANPDGDCDSHGYIHAYPNSYVYSDSDSYCYGDTNPETCADA
jgi:hypothetical protein